MLPELVWVISIHLICSRTHLVRYLACLVRHLDVMNDWHAPEDQFMEQIMQFYKQLSCRDWANALVTNEIL